jgi:hypothetical protein
VVNLICRKLPLGSLLALRETCKTTREWVDVENRSTLTEALKEVDIEIGFLGDLGRFLREVPNLPFSNFSLHGYSITSVEDFGNRDVIQFMERYGPIIRRLAIAAFWKCACDAEWSFYEGLKVLEDLCIGRIETPLSGSARIPSCIQKLKLLEISSSEEPTDPNDIPYCFQLFEKAKELETFIPWNLALANVDSSIDEEGGDEDSDMSFKKHLRYFMSALDRRAEGFGNKGETLKTVDLSPIEFNFNDEIVFDVQPQWLEFIQKILNCPANMMLRRVSSNMLNCVKEQLPLCFRQFAERIVSLDTVEWSPRMWKCPISKLFWVSVISILEPQILTDTSLTRPGPNYWKSALA